MNVIFILHSHYLALVLLVLSAVVPKFPREFAYPIFVYCLLVVYGGIRVLWLPS